MGALTLAEIWVYPVKALAGGRVAEARVDARGLVGDRRFMVVDEGGRFVTQREQARLAVVRPSLTEDTLRLQTPAGAAAEVPREGEGAPTEVVIWGETVPALDVGDEAAALLSEHVGVPLRLVRMPESTRRPADPEDARDGDLVAFQDGFPFLLAGRASLDAVNARLPAPVDMRRFRPNLVVEGSPAFAEDDWATLQIGDVTFHGRKLCSRCQVVDVDPDRGEPEKGVLAELARFRTIERGARFGQNLVHDGPGTVREGDQIIVSPASK